MVPASSLQLNQILAIKCLELEIRQWDRTNLPKQVKQQQIYIKVSGGSCSIMKINVPQSKICGDELAGSLLYCQDASLP